MDIKQLQDETIAKQALQKLDFVFLVIHGSIIVKKKRKVLLTQACVDRLKIFGALFDRCIVAVLV